MIGQEGKRKFVHIAMVTPALLIGRIPPWSICMCCAVAACFNLFVLPRLSSRALERPEDKQRGVALGIVIYPCVLLLLSVIFYQQQIFLVVAWGAMAWGDGFAGIIGRASKGPTLAWNPAKSWPGLFAFVGIGSLMTWVWVLLLPEPSRIGIGGAEWFMLISLAMIFAAWVESLPGLVDDNLAVPLVAALGAWIGYQSLDAPISVPTDWIWGTLVVTALVIASFVSRKMNLSGALVGGLIALLIYLGAGFPGVALLFTFFVLGSIASSWRRDRKKGLEQENKGRRSIRHAIANGGFSAFCGLCVWLHIADPTMWRLMLAAGLASATADTLSSELGNVYGKRFLNILTWRVDERGRDGVVSLEGTLLGALGASLVACVWFVATAQLWQSALIFAAGLVGNAIDSVLGASLQRKGLMTNDSVNFANTLSAGLFVVFVLKVVAA